MGHWRREGFPGETLIVLSPIQRQQLAKDPLCQELYFTDIGYFPRASDHYVERKKGSGEFVIQFCLSGEGFCEYGGNRHLVQANQYFVLPPNTAHTYGSVDGNEWKVGWIHFLGNVAPRLVEELTPLGLGVPHSMNFTRPWLRSFSDVVESLKYDLAYHNLAFGSTRLWSIMSALIYPGRLEMTEGSVSPVDKALRFMQRSVNSHVNLEDIANHAGLSISRLSVVFRQKTGIPPKEYLLRLKIQRACSYLSMTDWSVKDIASELGFVDPYYFSRCFKKRVGSSPKHYRQQQEA